MRVALETFPSFLNRFLIIFHIIYLFFVWKPSPCDKWVCLAMRGMLQACFLWACLKHALSIPGWERHALDTFKLLVGHSLSMPTKCMLSMIILWTCPRKVCFGHSTMKGMLWAHNSLGMPKARLPLIYIYGLRQLTWQRDRETESKRGRERERYWVSE